MMNVVERFLNYVAVDTESVEDATCFPSSEKQKNLAKMLVEELKSIGAENPRMDEYGMYMPQFRLPLIKRFRCLDF